MWLIVFFFASRRRHTRCALVTGVQTCALPILGTNASYSVIIDFSLRVPNGLQHGISERGDYANRVQGDAASHALNGAPYWTYMRRRAELSTQVFHSNGSEKALSYTRLVDRKSTRLNSSN